MILSIDQVYAIRMKPGRVLVEINPDILLDKIGSLYVAKSFNTEWKADLLAKVVTVCHRLNWKKKGNLKDFDHIQSEIEVSPGDSVYIEYHSLASAVGLYDSSSNGQPVFEAEGRKFIAVRYVDLQCKMIGETLYPLNGYVLLEHAKAPMSDGVVPMPIVSSDNAVFGKVISYSRAAKAIKGVSGVTSIGDPGLSEGDIVACVPWGWNRVGVTDCAVVHVQHLMFVVG